MKQFISRHLGLSIVVGFLLVSIVVSAFALTDFTIGAKTRLYAGNSPTDISFIAYNNDSVRVEAPLRINSGVTAGGTRFAVFDSFTTTSATKVLTMTGSNIGDVFQVTPMVTTYSAAVDTNCYPYYAKVDSAGYVTIGRTARLGQAAKSGAHFSAVHIDK